MIESNTSAVSEMPGQTTPLVDKWIRALCWLLVLASAVAAVLAHWQVETILGTCPAMAILGWVLTRLALQKNSLGLVLFGLFCPLMTSLIAFLIAIFQLSPGEAAEPVSVLLTVNAVLTTLWCGWIVLRVRRAAFLINSTRASDFQFSLARLMGIMTVVCLLAALLRNVDSSPEWIIFAGYGVVSLLVSVGLWVWFDRRVRRFRSESG